MSPIKSAKYLFNERHKMNTQDSNEILIQHTVRSNLTESQKENLTNTFEIFFKKAF